MRHEAAHYPAYYDPLVDDRPPLGVYYHPPSPRSQAAAAKHQQQHGGEDGTSAESVDEDVPKLDHEVLPR
jgi:hypothetical protein